MSKRKNTPIWVKTNVLWETKVLVWDRMAKGDTDRQVGEWLDQQKSDKKDVTLSLDRKTISSVRKELENLPEESAKGLPQNICEYWRSLKKQMATPPPESSKSDSGLDTKDPIKDITNQKPERQYQDNHAPLTVSNRQSEILYKLVKYLNDIEGVAQIMTGSDGYGPKKEDYREPFQKALNLAREELVNGRIFLPAEFVKTVESFFKKIAEMNIEFETAISAHIPNGLQRYQYGKKAAIIARQEIPKLLDVIENQARQIIKETDGRASQNELDRDKPLKEVVVEAQKEHLDRVRLHLSAFSKNFKEIDLKHSSYFTEYAPMNEDIRSHLPDDSFWQKVDAFKANDSMVKTIYDELYNEVKGKGESEIGLADDSDSGGIRITSNFITTIIELAVKICLGEPDDYHRYEWIPSVSKETFGGNFISVGIHSETKHRELVQDYAKDNRCEQLAAAVRQLRLLRGDILSRINKCANENEYVHYLCSHCHRL